jgi:hypothetical protein
MARRYKKTVRLVPKRWKLDPWWYELTGTPMPEGKLLSFPMNGGEPNPPQSATSAPSSRRRHKPDKDPA